MEGTVYQIYSLFDIKSSPTRLY